MGFSSASPDNKSIKATAEGMQELIELTQRNEKSSKRAFIGSIILSLTAILIALASYSSSRQWEKRQLQVLENIYSEIQQYIP